VNESPPEHHAPVSRVLMLVHSLPPAEHSGTPLIAHQYAQELGRRGIDVCVVYATRGSDNDQLGMHRLEGEAFSRFGVRETPWRWTAWCTQDVAGISQRDPADLQVFDELLRQFTPEVVHVIDNVHLPSELPTLARARGVPVIRSIWNTEELCGNGEPLIASTPTRLCPTPMRPAECATHYSLVLSDGEVLADDKLRALLEVKRQFTTLLFERFYDRVIFPTESFRDFYTRTLPIHAERLVVLEPGIDAGLPRAAVRQASSGIVNFVFLGTYIPRKGIGMLRDAFLHPALENRDDYTVSVYGDDDKSSIEDLEQRNPRVRSFGAYTPAELPEILADASVGLSPSWFETFHRVSREYLAAGVPVIGTTAFGIPEVVRDKVNGLLVEPGDVTGFVVAIVRVLEDRQLLSRLTEGASTTRIKSVEEEVDDLSVIYAEVVAAV